MNTKDGATCCCCRGPAVYRETRTIYWCNNCGRKDTPEAKALVALTERDAEIERLTSRLAFADARCADYSEFFRRTGCGGTGGAETGKLDGAGNEIVAACNCPACNADEFVVAFELWAAMKGRV